jgi:hypothetical protein
MWLFFTGSQSAWSVVCFNEGLVNLDSPGDSLEEERQRVRIDDARPLVRGRGLVRLLQVALSGVHELDKGGKISNNQL